MPKKAKAAGGGGGGAKKKAKTTDGQHPIDASGVLQAAKDGAFDKFASLLKSEAHLSFEDFNSLPPGRNYGVLHQIAFHGDRAALGAFLTAHPRVDLKMLTKDGKTAEEVAVEEGADASFLGFLRDCLRRQNVQELVSAARDGEWEKFSALLASSSVVTADLNTVPIGRKMGVIHQVSYWGDVSVLQALVADHPTLDLELRTEEDAPQTPLHIAQGRGHKAYCAALQGLLKSATTTTKDSSLTGGAEKGGSAADGGAAKGGKGASKGAKGGAAAAGAGPTAPAASSAPAAKAANAAKVTAKAAKAAKVTAVQWGGNTSLTLSDLLAILCEDGGAFFGRSIASRLLLKQLLCFGRVNKAFSKILLENLYKYLLCCRDVLHDPDTLIRLLVDGDKTELLLKIGKFIQVQGIDEDNLNVALHKAVEESAYAKILYLVNSGANVNSKVYGGKSFVGWGERDGDDELEHDKFPKSDDPWVEDTRTEEDIVSGVIFLDEEERNHEYESRRFGITALMRACACIAYKVREKEKDDDDADDEELPKYVYLCNDGGIVILLLLMLGADPKMGHWKSFGRAHFNYTGMGNGSLYETALHYCFREGNVRLVKALLSRGADANEGDVEDDGCFDCAEFKLSFLHLACGAAGGGGGGGAIGGDMYRVMTGGKSNFPNRISAPIVQALIKHGANVNEKACWQECMYDDVFDGMTPLDFAVFAAATALGNEIDEYSQLLENQKKTVQLLIENGANPDTVKPRLEQINGNVSEGYEGLSEGYEGYEEAMEEVMDEFKEILEGKHSLLAAAAAGNAQLVSKYITTGADVGARNLCGQTALLLACLCLTRHLEEGEEEEEEEEKEEEDDDDNDDEEEEEEEEAFSANYQAAAELLVEPTSQAGALDAKDSEGRTALMIASEWGMVTLVQKLVDKGADCGLTNKDGSTSLLLALKSGTARRAEEEEEAEKEEEEDTRTEEMRKAEEVAALLIAPTRAAGALDATDNDGVSSLMAARKNGLDGIVKMLLSAGAKPELTDE